jgi:DNA-binding NarL/FixJ family response regulator
MSSIVRIALLDDHLVVRAGLEAILAPEPDLHAVGFAADEWRVSTVLRRTRPDVVVLDLHDRGHAGLALCLKIKREPDPPSVVLYCADTPAALLVAAAVAGADTTAGISSATATLLEAIRAAARPPRTTPSISPRMKAAAAARLDPADHAILAMRLASNPSGDIATTLGVPRPGSRTGSPRSSPSSNRSEWRPDVHARLIATADRSPPTGWRTEAPTARPSRAPS